MSASSSCKSLLLVPCKQELAPNPMAITFFPGCQKLETPVFLLLLNEFVYQISNIKGICHNNSAPPV